VLHHSLTRLDHAYYVGPTTEGCPTCGRDAVLDRDALHGLA
jgi:hypothetical protein